MPQRVVRLGPEAVRHFKMLRATDRARLKKTLRVALGENDPRVENRNRFRLRRPSGQFEFELRDGDLRVFYRVEEEQVIVDAIGQKRGNQLFIGGAKVTL